MNHISSDYSDAHKSPLEQVCQERGVEMHSLWQMLVELRVKCVIPKGKDGHIEIDIPDDIMCGDYLARGRLAKEIRKYTPQIIKALGAETPASLININTIVTTVSPSNRLSFTLPGTEGVVESITAVIDGAGLKKLSKWIKPTGNNPTGLNLNLKLGEQQKGRTVTKPVSPISSIISSSYSSVKSFVADLEKAGVSLAYADERLQDERLQMDASRLMETPTGSEDLSNIIEGMKVYMSANKDELLKYLQTTLKFSSV